MERERFAVEVSELTVRFGEFTAVDGISFAVRRGEIFGFLGANGAGKTTTIRVLCGLLIPTSGRVLVAGHGFEETDAIKRQVGYMSQKFTLYDDLSVLENLSFVAGLRKLPEELFRKRSNELLEFAGFSRSPDTLVRDLPGGIKQQVSLVASILHDPEVVFLDEPTAGVTPVARARFWTLIRHLARAGKTVFVTTHYMDEAEQCDRIALMRAGRIVALDSPERLKDSTFSEPLFELEATSDSRANEWLDRVRKSPAVSRMEPHGMRYHVTVKDSREWEALCRAMAGVLTARQIRPSLEDVFIRLVEGRGR